LLISEKIMFQIFKIKLSLFYKFQYNHIFDCTLCKPLYLLQRKGDPARDLPVSFLEDLFYDTDTIYT